MKNILNILKRYLHKFRFDFLSKRCFTLFVIIEVIRIFVKQAFLPNRKNFIFWSQALMTTGAAIIATAFFSSSKILGALTGFILLVIAAILNLLVRR